MADIRYNFVATGAQDVEATFRTITKSAKQAAAQVEALQKSKKKLDAPGGANSQEAQKQKELVRAAEKVAKAKEVAAKQAARATEQAAKQSARAQDKAAKDAAKAQERGAKAGAKAIESAQRITARALAAVDKERQREFEKAEKKRTTIANREAKKRARAEEKAAKAEARAVAREDRARRNRNADLRNGIGRRFASVGKAAIIGGAAIAGVAVRDSMRLQETSTRLAINARGSGEKMIDPTTLRKEFEATAIATPGVKAADIAEAASKFVSLTGDFDTARASLKTFATIASATGADVGDISEAAASLSNQLGIKSEEDFKDVFASLIAQGKGGAFELADMAAQFQRLAASGGAFGIEQNVQGVKTLGGFTQIARAGTGSPEQAATAVEAVLTNLKVKSDDLKKAGVNVYDKSGKTRNLADVLSETVAKVGGGNIEKKNSELAKIFGAYGGRALNPLITTFQSSYNGTNGSEQEKLAAATRAVREQFDQATNAAGTWKDVVQDAAVAQSLTSSKLTNAWERFVSIAGDKLTPTIADFIGKLAELSENTNAFERIADGLNGLADVIDSIVKQLVSLGILKVKDRGEVGISKAENARDAAVATVLAKGDKATPEDAKAVTDAEAEVSHAIAKDRARSQFMSEYDTAGAAGGPARKDADWLDKVLGFERGVLGAGITSHDVVDDTFAGKNGNETFNKASGETEEQFKIRQRWRSRANGNGEGGGEGSTQAMTGLAAAAKAAAEAMLKVSQSTQGSIVPKP